MKKEIYYIATDSGTTYLSYDREKRNAQMKDGSSVLISEDRFADFLHTAELLGFKTGKL